MLQFRDIELSDKQWIDEALKRSDFMGCEYTFANNLAWRRLNNTKIAKFNDFYISRSSYGDNQYCYTFPSGELPNAPADAYREVFEAMREDARQLGSDFIVGSVTDQNLPIMNELLDGEFELIADENGFDYIYNSQDLIEFKGKKYHSKRNHIKNFKKNNWSFEPICSENIEEALKFAVNFYNENEGYQSFSSVAEQYAINTFFTYFSELNLVGGLLRVDGEIVALGIGEGINSNTFAVHIEKAKREFQGAYATICNEFVSFSAKDYQYINREEDLGIEGLRHSKQSYYPAFMLKKYTLKFK